jgi:DNA-binding CsgD family transcriptional regulator
MPAWSTISVPRTVGYHLYNAYPKLGVASRAELAHLLTKDRP